MAGLVPAIHVLLVCGAKDVDARDKPGHDGGVARKALILLAAFESDSEEPRSGVSKDGPGPHGSRRRYAPPHHEELLLATNRAATPAYPTGRCRRTPHRYRQTSGRRRCHWHK